MTARSAVVRISLPLPGFSATPFHSRCPVANVISSRYVAASPASALPSSCLIDVDVLWAASHAVAVIEQSATSTDAASSRASTLCTGPVHQLVADSVHGQQVRGCARLNLDLLAQVHDMGVDGAGRDVPVEPVHRAEQ